MYKWRSHRWARLVSPRPGDFLLGGGSTSRMSRPLYAASTLFSPERWCVTNFSSQLCRKKCSISGQSCCFFSCWPSRVAWYPSVSCASSVVLSLHVVVGEFLAALWKSSETLTYWRGSHTARSYTHTLQVSTSALLMYGRVFLLVIRFVGKKELQYFPFILKWMKPWFLASRCRLAVKEEL